MAGQLAGGEALDNFKPSNTPCSRQRAMATQSKGTNTILRAKGDPQ